MCRSAAIPILVILAGVRAPAQNTRGAVSGTLTDSTGSVLNDVKVSLVNLATGVRIETATNREGLYRSAAIEPGEYRLEFEKSGFQSVEIGRIEVRTVQETVVDQTLPVATVAGSVTVTAAPPGVELNRIDATVERTFPQQFVEAVPVSGRASSGPHNLVLLAPNASRNTSGLDPPVSINGSRFGAVNLTIDGTANTTDFLGIPVIFRLRESIDTVNAQTNAYSAEFGRGAGHLSIITRSGSNRFHGELYDYYSGDWMQALPLADKRVGLEAVRSVNHHFGGSLGGPIIRNRTFFFVQSAWLSRRSGPAARTAGDVTLPTPDGYSALTRVPLGPGQDVESRRAILKSIALLPEIHARIQRFDGVRTVMANGVPVEVGRTRLPFANKNDDDVVVTRLDHRFNGRDSVTSRAEWNEGASPNTNLYASNLQFGTRFSSSGEYRARAFSGSHVRILSPNLVNEFRATHSYGGQAYLNKTEEAQTVVSGLFTLGPNALTPQRTKVRTLQFQDVISWLSGRHSLKVGADVRSLRMYELRAANQRGSWIFNNLEDFLNNRANALSIFAGDSDYDARTNNQFYFVQDNFKPLPNLTLSVGLRYEYHGVPLGFFGAATPEIAAIGVPGPVRSDRNNWAPRAAIAYSPSGGKWLLGEGQTVIRGGWGVSYDLLTRHLLNTSTNQPRGQALTFQARDIAGLYPSLLSGTPNLNAFATFNNLPADAQLPTTHFYNFSIQRQFGSNYVAEIGYTGARHYHQVRLLERNPAILTASQAATVIAGGTIPSANARRVNPAWGPRVEYDTGAGSYYNALTVRFDRKLSRGLLIGGHYTWSSTLSENDGGHPQDYFNVHGDYGRSLFDRPHRAVLLYLFEIPSLARKSRILRHALGGWQVTGFSEWQSGTPFSIETGVDSLGYGIGATFTARPDYNPAGAIARDPVTGDWRTFRSPLTGGAFVTPLGRNGLPLANSMTRGGSLGRNTLRAPAFALMNASLMKTFPLTERWRFQVRGEFVNGLNHRNFGAPVTSMNNPNFGMNTSNVPARTVQLLAKLRF